MCLGLSRQPRAPSNIAMQPYAVHGNPYPGAAEGQPVGGPGGYGTTGAYAGPSTYPASSNPFGERGRRMHMQCYCGACCAAACAAAALQVPSASCCACREQASSCRGYPGADNRLPALLTCMSKAWGGACSSASHPGRQPCSVWSCSWVVQTCPGQSALCNVCLVKPCEAGAKTCDRPAHGSAGVA